MPATGSTSAIRSTAFSPWFPTPTAFFFTTHILATEALRYFHDRGIDISDGRLGLACMHEDPLFRLAAPG